MDVQGNGIFMSVLEKLDRLLDRYAPGGMPDNAIPDHQAFFWDGARKTLLPISRPVQVDPALLVGIDRQRDMIMENTRRFAAGGPANNVLLWGERGTGKSSLVKSLLTAYAGTDLRMIQVLAHDILTIRNLYGVIARNERFRFVLFIDDLSFEEGETDYKEMKTIMDGGLEQLPPNLVFYATSNRKHLMPTRFPENSDDIRPGDTMEEKVSLADRFGLQLGFYHFDQDTYLEIVDRYAARAGIVMDRERLHEEAVRWAMGSGGRNGRAAELFVRTLVLP